MPERNPIVVAVPGEHPVVVSHLLLDFNGTLAEDGNLLPGVAARLRKLGRQLRIVVAVVTFLGFAFVVPTIWWFAIFFSLAGVFIAWEDTTGGVAVRDYVKTEIAGTAYGVLGVVNGIGDFGSSLIVGLLWTAVGPTAGFLYAVVVGAAGATLMAATPAQPHKQSIQ